MATKTADETRAELQAEHDALLGEIADQAAESDLVAA